MKGIAVPALLAALAALALVAHAAPGTSGKAAAPAPARPADTARAEVAGFDGEALYDRFCLACHGTFGDGRGPAAPWLWPRPRDFTRGEYKWRTTPSGAGPSDDDLARAIRFGVPGTTMHAFGATLGEREIAALVAVVKGFAPRAFAPAARIEPGAPPPPDPDRGRQVYQRLGCAACHGDGGRGDGPAAEGLLAADGSPGAPYDLTARPLRRPRAPDEPAVVAIYTSLVTGLAGTAMPAYQGAASTDDLWAVASFIDALRYRGAPVEGRVEPIHPIAARLDREQRLTRGGYWPGRGDEVEEAIWGETIPLQGPAPAALAPAQASLASRQCARCHASQVRDWTGSLHGGAAGPGVVAQLLRTEGRERAIESCQRCHAPLAEQHERLRPGQRGGDDTDRSYTANPGFDAELRGSGISCAACHVRGWRRFGPPRSASSSLLALPGYPLTESRIYERSDFCLPCHQLRATGTLEGRPLLDTYREWLEGPYMRRGVQCQHCHMPNREHTWKGIHDPDTFRQGIRVEAAAARARTGAVTVRVKVHNVGAGHYLPTTPTPAAFVTVELLDGDGRPVRGARAEQRIGRHIDFVDGRFVEHEDTRIPPGQAREMARAWKDGRVAEAKVARVIVRVEPDEYYQRFYERRLRGRLPAEERRLYEEALARAKASPYVAVERLVPVN